MTIYPITPKHPAACYGVGGCPHHSNCQRYQAVEETNPSDTVATCSDGHGAWPWFVATKETEHARLSAAD